ncbi:MAG: glycoside hydrolase family 15 protein [Bryobacteraceae bacterium]|nr:glycoside hydrolase family 15 protein [Bryobacteraceae bacterium]
MRGVWDPRIDERGTGGAILEGAMTNGGFSPIRRTDGYLPIEDYGLIGDGKTAALVGRDGSVAWLCAPRFDSPPLFCEILDAKRGGGFRVAPRDLATARQYYEPDTGVLHTEMQTPAGLVRLTDALTLQSGVDLREGVSAARHELVRRVAVLDGEAWLNVELTPRGPHRAEQAGGGLRIACPQRADLPLHLSASFPLEGLRSTLRLRAGESAFLVLRWSGATGRQTGFAPEAALDQTADVWRRWTARCRYEGPQKALVCRSAITLKLLDYFESGAMVAAPTSSLPEAIGGVRNWDYRFAWIRDAAFSVFALHRIGYSDEAAAFLSWVLDAVERHGQPQVLYDLDGLVPEPEREDGELEGYRRSAPVRWGNGAADQVQHDVYGEILDCAYQWAGHHGALDAALWKKLRSLIETAARVWRKPDHGIWEVRTPGRAFTYSAALCQVALDRGARLARRYGLPADVERWQATADEIRDAILDEAWDPELNSLTEHLGGGGLDASLLTLPIRRIVRPYDPRMVATTEAIVRRLGAGGGLLYRYLPHESPDGLPGEEGAFLLCSFWLVDNLAGQGRMQEAMDLYDSLCARAGPLGLLPEQIDAASGAFLGNYPQAFSHIGVIASGFNLARKLVAASKREEPPLDERLD